MNKPKPKSRKRKPTPVSVKAWGLFYAGQKCPFETHEITITYKD